MSCMQVPSYFVCLLLWTSFRDFLNDTEIFGLSTKQSRWILLAPALAVERVVNASPEHRKLVTGTKEVLQRAAQEAAKLQSKTWQACLWLFNLTTKETPGREEIWSRSSVRMCCARSRIRMLFSKCVMFRYAYTRAQTHTCITTYCSFLEPENSLCLGLMFGAVCDISTVDENISAVHCVL